MGVTFNEPDNEENTSICVNEGERAADHQASPASTPNTNNGGRFADPMWQIMHAK